MDITPNFPKAYKFSIGEKMHELSIGLIQEIAAAYMNRARDIRVQHLTEFQTIAELISRWAPANENNTSAYIRSVCREMQMPSTYVPDLCRRDNVHLDMMG